MKLNPDCIRDILLWLEENQKIEVLSGMTTEIMSTEMPKYIPGYSNEDVLYSIKQMTESYLLSAVKMDVNGADWYRIKDITPAGHEFLGNIRSPENWQKTKSIASKIGAVTIDVLSKVAGSVVAELIKNSIGGTTMPFI
jgi:hypothetical protein